MGGYKMARVKTRYSRFCFLFCIAPMMIPFQSFMLTLVNVATTLHINGKIWGLAIIYWGLGAPMSIFLYQGFAKGIPLELEESALIDGCNQFQLFTRIIFPMLKSCTATVTIINVMWIWNDCWAEERAAKPCSLQPTALWDSTKWNGRTLCLLRS